MREGMYAMSSFPRLGIRWFAITLLAALAMGLFVACGDDEQQAQQPSSAAQQEQPQPSQDDAQQAQPAQQQEQPAPAAAQGPLKIAFLADFSGGLAEYGLSMQRGFELAIRQVNAAGGVWGQPVEIVFGDTALDPTQATEEARRLIEVERVHAIVGPLASSITLAVVESVAADAGVLVVSPSATSPQITISEDNDFLFRSSPSDAAQGPVLAQLAADQGLSQVGVLYRNDAWGQGLADAFGSSWGGSANFVAIEVGRTSYIAELQQAASGGMQALVAMAFPPESEVFIREALEQGLFEHFIFTDGNKSQDLIDAIGGEYLNGMQGTAPVSGPETEALLNYRADFAAEFGEGADEPFVAQAYDAALVVALAAEHAGRDDRAAIRDSLRAVAGPPGSTIQAGADGVAEALAAIRAGEDIDIAGASTSLDFDVNGDIATGFIGVWQYAEGTIAEVSVTAFDLSGGPLVVTPGAEAEAAPVVSDEPLKIGLLADFSGPLAEFGPSIQSSVELAVKQLNDAGGVLGHPVRLVTGDTALDPTQATEEARRLIEVEGVHAIVGPLSSAITLAVVESVAADAGVLVISPSATSPQLTIAEDNDFLFRSTVSDAAQGPVLAQLAADEGYSNVGVIYLNDPYGQGLAEAFNSSWSGDANLVSIEPRQATYLAELQQAADNGAEALIVIAFPQEAEIFIREALEQGLFDEFLFVDGSKSQELVDAIGGEYLEGMRGTAPSAGPESPALLLFNQAYIAEYGELSPLPFVAEAYDATIAIGVAAQAAGSLDSAAIRDSLRSVAGPPGDPYAIGGEGVGAALAAVAEGWQVDLEGAATSLDWDENGDITSGYIGVWAYEGGEIVEISVTAFDLTE
ncbi:MAG: ABC transporter substrate-binding protein [Chloroflexi bacterium]|nr:ABC transporter substrate-binding protein [Chloroflexota bacterium]MYF81363.1 ABC transporter substrate-binding protein [Chloroflexota bacterium]MYI04971.1 ABC transporter substrate-binding protein [Chloroflexota bacterium]